MKPSYSKRPLVAVRTVNAIFPTLLNPILIFKNKHIVKKSSLHILKEQQSILQQRRLYKLFIKQYYSIPSPLEHTGNDVKAQFSHMRAVISARFTVTTERANIRKCAAPILKVECHSISLLSYQIGFQCVLLFSFFLVFSHFFHTRASDHSNNGDFGRDHFCSILLACPRVVLDTEHSTRALISTTLSQQKRFTREG